MVKTRNQKDKNGRTRLFIDRGTKHTNYLKEKDCVSKLQYCNNLKKNGEIVTILHYAIPSY